MQSDSNEDHSQEVLTKWVSTFFSEIFQLDKQSIESLVHLHLDYLEKNLNPEIKLTANTLTRPSIIKSINAIDFEKILNEKGQNITDLIKLLNLSSQAISIFDKSTYTSNLKNLETDNLPLNFQHLVYKLSFLIYLHLKCKKEIYYQNSLNYPDIDLSTFKPYLKVLLYLIFSYIMLLLLGLINHLSG